VLPSGSGTDIVVPGLAGSEAIAIPEERFTELTETLCATPKPVRLEGMTVIKGNTAQLHSLRRAAVALVANPELENGPEDLSNLISATIDWIGHSSSRWRPERLDDNAAPMRVAKLAKNYIEECYRQPIRSVELCRLAGVSVRTLQRCFREYFDLTVTSYLNTVRLEATHRDLSTAHPQHVSIAEIALRNGHSHLGRFSVHYRKRYGVSPKVTLALGSGQKS
jgi:AraC-like DNA-binding protein